MARKQWVVAAVVLGTAVLAASPEDPDRVTDEREVSFRVRVCEGEEFKRLLGSEAEDAWGDCERPLTEIPVVLRGGEAKDGPRETDKDGVVSLGPIRVKGDQRITLVVGCKKHVCLTLNIDALGVRDGVNHFLYHTVRLEKLKEEPKDGSAS